MNAPTTATSTDHATPTLDDLRAAALEYAGRGWHVVPEVPGGKRPAFPDHTETTCTRTDPKCRAAGNHLGWEPRATTDSGRITRAWSSPTPTGPYGVGIACGPSGLVVIDCDTPKGDVWPEEWRIPGITCGADVLAHIADRLGERVAPTYTVTTPSGGTHLYYLHPAEPAARIRNTVGTARGPLGWLVDVRAHGGQVVAPPTTVNGHAYTVTDDQTPVPLPGWIAEQLQPAARPTGGRTPIAPADPWAPPERRQAYLNAAINAETRRVTTATEGGRNHALFLASLALGQLVAGGELDADHVRSLLLDAAAPHLAAGAYSRHQAGATITSGLRRGATRPRYFTEAA